MRRRPRAAWWAAFSAWAVLTVFALGAAASYASRAGVAAQAPVTWPTASTLPRNPGRATLVMVAHTKCACTRASLRELERGMARAHARLDVFVVFVGPQETSVATGLLDLRATARAIPGVRVIEDESEAVRFGAKTSGQVLLYDADARGTLLFRGGLTPSRGHEGDSVGGETVRRFVAGSASSSRPAGTALAQSSDVFGCALFNHPNDDVGTNAGAKKDP